MNLQEKINGFIQDYSKYPSKYLTRFEITSMGRLDPELKRSLFNYDMGNFQCLDILFLYYEKPDPSGKKKDFIEVASLKYMRRLDNKYLIVYDVKFA